MVEALGNKLKINSIDIIPSNIDHHNEYLKVADDESKYDLLSVEEMGRQLNVSYEKVGCVNKGNNRVTDVFVTNFSTNNLTSICSKGFVVTTNVTTAFNDSHPLENAYKGFAMGNWIAPSMENSWICLQCPVPMAYTDVIRTIPAWYSDITNYTPYHFIIEASNDNNDFDVLLEVMEQEVIPHHKYTYTFNEEKIKYRYWRIRYPEALEKGQMFNFCFRGVIEKNLYTQTEFQKNKLVKLSPIWFNPQIPYRTDYTDVLNHGTVSGSNLTTYDDNNVVWQAFRGQVNGSNTGWMSASTQTFPCDLIYTFNELQEEGHYMFMFRNGIWGDNNGYCTGNVAIILIDENNNEYAVWNRLAPNIQSRIISSDVVDVPFKFKAVKWRITSDYGTYSSMGWCQVLKFNEQGQNNSSYYNTLMANVGNHALAGGYLCKNDIQYIVDENNPLEVTFNDRYKEVFTSLDPIKIEPQKKFRLITPKHVASYNYDKTTHNYLTDEYHEIVRGTVSGIGTETNAFWYAIATDVRGTESCWKSTEGSVTGGPIYKWNQVKPKGRYVFKFNTGWSTTNSGNGAKQVRVSVRYGDSDTWKEIWNVNNIPNSFGSYFWSPAFDIDFEFDQVYFEVVSAHSTIVNLANCAVFQEWDRDYVMDSYNIADFHRTLWERTYQYAIDYYESQNLFIRKDGTTYGLSSLIYRQDEEPKEPKENDIWYDNSREPLKVYQYKEGSWKPFNDVLLGNFNLFNGLIQTFHENPYNDNGTTKNQDCIWSTELTLSDIATSYDGDVFLKSGMNSVVYHNLNIQDVTKYKAEFYYKDNDGHVYNDSDDGYICWYKNSTLVSDIYYGTNTPYLTKNSIGVYGANAGNIVFKIREL